LRKIRDWRPPSPSLLENRIELIDQHLMQCMFFVRDRRRRRLPLLEGAIRSATAECAWLRIQELQVMTGAATS
jgi:hypothetical protein